ncbi:hypothetical protein [Leucobacter sp. GX24907]
MTTKTDLTAALRQVIDEHDHGALGGRLLEEALADAALTVLSKTGNPGLISEARTLAARKIEDSSDGEAVQIMLGLICDQLEATVTVPSEGVTTAAREPFDPYLTPDEVKDLPVGSVVMTETDPEVFGFYEQRVWQRFGGEPDWQFKSPRHDWQSTDGGFQRVADRDWPPVFAQNRRVRLLFTPGPLPVGGEGKWATA